MDPSSSTPPHNGTTIHGSSEDEGVPSTNHLKKDEFPQWTTLKISPLKLVPLDDVENSPSTSSAANDRPISSKLTTSDYWGNFTQPRAEMICKVDELRLKKFQRIGVYEGPSHDLMDFSQLPLGWVEQNIKCEKNKKRVAETRIPQRMHYKLKSRRERVHLANIVEEDENDSDATSGEDWIQETKSSLSGSQSGF